VGRLVLGFDFETTGLDTKNDRIIEVGAVLWDWDRATPLEIMNELVRHEGIELSSEISTITGIETDDLMRFGKPIDKVLNRLLAMAHEAEAMMAHNAPFDEGMLLAECARLQWTGDTKRLLIDTVTDIEYHPIKHKQKNLVTLAATHGFLNPFPHRAVTDVLSMCKIASQYDFDAVKARAKSPNVTVVAIVSFDEKEKAKAAGFYWKPETKEWYRKMKECDLKPNHDFGFKVDIQREMPL